MYPTIISTKKNKVVITIMEKKVRFLLMHIRAMLMLAFGRFIAVDDVFVVFVVVVVVAVAVVVIVIVNFVFVIVLILF